MDAVGDVKQQSSGQAGAGTARAGSTTVAAPAPVRVPRGLPKLRIGRLILLAAAVAVGGSAAWHLGSDMRSQAHVQPDQVVKAASRNADGYFTPSADQWAALTIEAVTPQTFRAVVSTDGRIAIDEERTTPVFSPYAGRVVALHARPGERIEAGQPLFTIAASDMVQSQNDLMAAVAAYNKASSAVRLAEVNYTRTRNLYEIKAGSQREFQAAEDQRNAAVADRSAAEAAREAVRNKLRLLGKSDEEILAFEREGRISAETVIKSPLSGTVVQRKVGPGQFVAGATSDAVFVIGDLSTVWVVANVKETDAPSVALGQPIEFRVLAFPGKTFEARLDYISAAVDTSTRRLLVRASIPNPEGMLKPEMFAMVDIVTSNAKDAASISRGAVIYDGEAAHVWAIAESGTVARRRIKVGAASGDRVQVLRGLEVGDRIVAKGSLFIDRLAASAE